MRRADFIAGAIGVMVGGGAITIASDFPADVVMNVGPAFFPTMLAGLFVLSSAALMVSAALDRGADAPVATPSVGMSLDNGTLRAVLTVAGVLAFCLALRPVGFLPTSLVFLIAMMFLLGMRSLPRMVAVAMGVTGGIYLVFERLLGLTLPSGVLDSLLY